MSDKVEAHAELLDDGSYHCLLMWPNAPEPIVCHTIEWSEDDIVEHLRNGHKVSGQIVFTGNPELIVHRSAMHDRVETGCNYHGCLREKAFADAWEKAQQDDHILAALSSKSVAKGTPGSWKPLTRTLADEHRVRSWSTDADDELYSQRDAIVAATVIQWLGTNVGFSWLDETLRKAGYIVELEAARRTRDGDRDLKLSEYVTAARAYEQRAEVLHAAFIKAHAAWSAVELLVSGHVREIMLAALRFASAHCRNEAVLFESFVDAQIKDKSERREPFVVERSTAGNTLHSIANQIRDAISVLYDLRDLVKRTAIAAPSDLAPARDVQSEHETGATKA